MDLRDSRSGFVSSRIPRLRHLLSGDKDCMRTAAIAFTTSTTCHSWFGLPCHLPDRHRRLESSVLAETCMNGCPELDGGASRRLLPVPHAAAAVILAHLRLGDERRAACTRGGATCPRMAARPCATGGQPWGHQLSACIEVIEIGEAGAAHITGPAPSRAATSSKKLPVVRGV